jgi:hypothetical protein
MSKRLTLIPAIRKAGKVYPGKPGGSHDDIIRSKALGMKAKDNEHGFLTPDDKFLTREQGMDWLKKAKPALHKQLDDKDITELRSHDLAPRKSAKQRMIEEPL